MPVDTDLPGDTVQVSSTTADRHIGSSRARGLRLVSAKARLLLLLPAADSIVIIGLLVYLEAGSGWDSEWVGLLAYNLLSPVALAALVVLTAGLWPRGMPVTAVTCVVFSGIIVAALLDTSSSATGVLLLLFLPIWFCVALIPFAGFGVLVHGLRGRRATTSVGP